MIEITNLLSKPQLPGNYFAYNAYIKGDLELGLLENRLGSRLLGLPLTLLQAIYTGLEQETGQATPLVLFNCGRWWGKNFYVRFCEETSEYYGKAVAQMEMIEFIQCLQQCWKTHGWGTFDLDARYTNTGFLILMTKNSPFASAASHVPQHPACFLEAGVFSSFFSRLTGRDLHCVQTTCESMGADCNYFILGLSNRLQAVEAWVDEGKDHETILKQLCETS
ncbi:V4R domain-containing protein [Planktothrix mougeotii]|uniref:4-vinyl reductase n=1 Tax=Planktothrix mougeotii LEGE 06226 TaxID=1828728 RepID=A0ABR9UG79_9CYAN|nr:V4R domain-containing protein [Planktothrix mougeotii]MBE9144569.1 4-vinyl reductase [Planktothrix mougeotii LEGE 06226]